MAENQTLSSRVGSSDEGKPRRRASRLARALKRIAVLLLLLGLAPLLLLPLYRYVNPPVTTVMLLKRLGGAPIGRQWVALENISPHLVRSVLSSEDARFCEHNGIDWVELENALGAAEEGGRLRGASTITMQTVKNLFLWAERDWLRKILEAPLALYADFVLSKKRIMEVYLNVAEWDTGVYGAEAAARSYFAVSAADLSPSQAARLAAILPAPGERDAADPGPQTRRAAERIQARAEQSGPYVTCVLD